MESTNHDRKCYRATKEMRDGLFYPLPLDDPLILTFPPLSTKNVIPPMPRREIKYQRFYVVSYGESKYIYFPSLQCYTPKCSIESCPQDVRDIRFSILHMQSSGVEVKVRTKATIPEHPDTFYRQGFLCKDHKITPRREIKYEELEKLGIEEFQKTRCNVKGGCLQRATMTGGRCFKHRLPKSFYLEQFRCEKKGCKRRWYRVHYSIHKRLCQYHAKLVDFEIYKNRYTPEPPAVDILDQFLLQFNSIADVTDFDDSH